MRPFTQKYVKSAMFKNAALMDDKWMIEIVNPEIVPSPVNIKNVCLFEVQC